jgi:tRNA-binding protein
MKISLMGRVIAMAFSWLCTFGYSFHPALVIGQKSPDEKGLGKLLQNVTKTSQNVKKGVAMHLVPDQQADAAELIDFAQFLAVDIRVGKLLAAEPLRHARKPAYVLTIDFGDIIGVKKSSAQITEHYTPEELPGRLVAAVVNLPPRQIGTIMSEVLTLGFPDASGAVVLFTPDREVPLGSRLF